MLGAPAGVFVDELIEGPLCGVEVLAGVGMSCFPLLDDRVVTVGVFV